MMYYRNGIKNVYMMYCRSVQKRFVGKLQKRIKNRKKRYRKRIETERKGIKKQKEKVQKTYRNRKKRCRKRIETE